MSSRREENEIVYDLVVVGAGVEGSATAYYAAKQGYRTLLLEQFALPHSRGSSHGPTRIIRRAYEEDFYTAMMPDAYDMWFTLEKEVNDVLYQNGSQTEFRKAGILYMDDTGSSYVDNCIKALEGIGAVYEVLDHKGLEQRFPMTRFKDPRWRGVYDREGGTLFAEKCVRALQNMFAKFGGTIRDREPVLGFRPGPLVHITTTKGTHLAKSVVIAAGPWAPRLLKPLGIHLPLVPTRIQVYYWKARTPQYTVEAGFTNFIANKCIHGKHDIFGMTSSEYPNLVKICQHHGSTIDPDYRDEPGHDQKRISEVGQFIREHFPGVESDKPSIVENCIYTVTPDENFVLDTHPHWKNIAFGAGFSGHGFKMAPVIGKILVDLATGKRQKYDIEPLSMERFFSAKTSKM